MRVPPKTPSPRRHVIDIDRCLRSITLETAAGSKVNESVLDAVLFTAHSSPEPPSGQSVWQCRRGHNGQQIHSLYVGRCARILKSKAVCSEDQTIQQQKWKEHGVGKRKTKSGQRPVGTTDFAHRQEYRGRRNKRSHQSWQAKHSNRKGCDRRSADARSLNRDRHQSQCRKGDEHGNQSVANDGLAGEPEQLTDSCVQRPVPSSHAERVSDVRSVQHPDRPDAEGNAQHCFSSERKQSEYGPRHGPAGRSKATHVPCNKCDDCPDGHSDRKERCRLVVIGVNYSDTQSP